MSVPDDVHERIMAAGERIAATGETAPRAGRDPVNQPMIHNWVEAIGDANPPLPSATAWRRRRWRRCGPWAGSTRSAATRTTRCTR